MPEVFLERATDYPHTLSILPGLLDCILPDLTTLSVLVKPNFVALRNANLACTNAHFIHSVAVQCRERGAKVIIGDSPAFGSAQAIASHIGLTTLLPPDIPIITLGRGVPHTSGGFEVSISADALEADLIINMPKCKAHSQMRYTGAVKNLFGCVVGIRKALLHARHGDHGHDFLRMICGFMDILPPTISIMDGVIAMHETGPINGKPFALHLLGASTNPVALDTALGMIFGKQPHAFPIWAECLRQNRLGAKPEELSFPHGKPEDFPADGFLFPHDLKPESFRPDVLIRSLIKRLWMSLR